MHFRQQTGILPHTLEIIGTGVLLHEVVLGIQPIGYHHRSAGRRRQPDFDNNTPIVAGQRLGGKYARVNWWGSGLEL